LQALNSTFPDVPWDAPSFRGLPLIVRVFGLPKAHHFSNKKKHTRKYTTPILILSDPIVLPELLAGLVSNTVIYSMVCRLQDAISGHGSEAPLVPVQTSHRGRFVLQ
jgi:hypothetical protein